MDKLPEKIIRFDVLQIKRDMKKSCNCYRPHYEVDTLNRLITCIECGAIIEPFEAMARLAHHCDWMNERIEALLDERKKIENYKPWLIVIRNLERNYRGGKMVPVCPNCHEPFDLADINVWANRQYLNKKSTTTDREEER